MLLSVAVSILSVYSYCCKNQANIFMDFIDKIHYANTNKKCNDSVWLVRADLDGNGDRQGIW